VVFEVVHGLPDGIRRSLKPLVTFIGLFGGQNVHKAMREGVEVVGVFYMLI